MNNERWTFEQVMNKIEEIKIEFNEQGIELDDLPKIYKISPEQFYNSYFGEQICANFTKMFEYKTKIGDLLDLQFNIFYDRALNDIRCTTYVENSEFMEVLNNFISSFNDVGVRIEDAEDCGGILISNFESKFVKDIKTAKQLKEYIEKLEIFTTKLKKAFDLT